MHQSCVVFLAQQLTGPLSVERLGINYAFGGDRTKVGAYNSIIPTVTQCFASKADSKIENT